MFGGSEEFWTHSPVSHKRSLGGRQGGEGNVGIQLILFQKLFVLNLISLVTLLGSLRSTKIFECWSQYSKSIFKNVLSYITPPAQQTLVQTSAVVLQLKRPQFILL